LQTALAAGTLAPPAASLEELRKRATDHLLSPEQAEREFGALARRIISTLAKGRYGELKTFVGPSGLCLRAAQGGECQTFSAEKVAACSSSTEVLAWGVDTGADELPKYSCGEAFKKVFYARDFRKAKPRFNCFPAPGRGNNPNAIIQAGPYAAYVEFYVGSNDIDWQALWLVFDESDGKPMLRELIAEYSGI